MKTKFGLLGLVMSFLFIGCSGDNQNDSPMTAEDLTVSAKMDEMSDDISNIAIDQYAKQSQAAGKSVNTTAKYLPDCVTENVSVTGNTWTRIIDFGDGCSLKNGNILKGKIIISGSVDFQQSSYTVNCSFDKFYHNDNLVQGKKVFVRTLEPTSNLTDIHPVLNIDLDLKVTNVNGIVRTVVGNRTREMVAGFDTPLDWHNDVYLISGNQSVTSPKGKITSIITKPLVVKMNCNHIVQGTIVHTKNNKTATLDFGNEEDCDNIATVTINGAEKTISLGKN